MRRRLQSRAIAAALALTCAPFLHAAEHITFRNGFELDCIRREPIGNKVRLFLTANSENYMDVAADSILRVETLPDPPPPAPKSIVLLPATPAPTTSEPTLQELTQMLATAGTQHNIDADLLAAVVKAESGGHSKAVSHAGARGLMQLMPATAATLGVVDAFVPAQNVEGGTKYLDQLLTRYHDNIALALAAYNAGPGAVDKYHGVPPYRETRAYVARIIRDFNHRKTVLLASNKAPR